MVLMVLKDKKVLLVHKVSKVLLVHKVVVVLKVQLVHKVHTGQKGTTGTGTQGTTGQKGAQGTTGSNAGITTYQNAGNHRIITGTSASSIISGESNLTFNGATLNLNGNLNVNDSGDECLLVDPANGTFSIGDTAEVGGGGYLDGDADDMRWYNGGSIRFKVDGNGKVTAASDIIAYGSPSDRRLKENIKPIESALDKAMKLEGVTFDWKESDSILKLKEDVGFIAQDVQKVIPELVRENENGMLSMRHQGIAPILLEAIKELKAEIDLLKSKPCNCNCKCNK